MANCSSSTAGSPIPRYPEFLCCCAEVVRALQVSLPAANPRLQIPLASLAWFFVTAKDRAKTTQTLFCRSATKGSTSRYQKTIPPSGEGPYLPPTTAASLGV
jgi:hypothetical protein